MAQKVGPEREGDSTSVKRLSVAAVFWFRVSRGGPDRCRWAFGVAGTVMRPDNPFLASADPGLVPALATSMQRTA